MAESRKRWIVRRAVLVVACVVLAPFLYGCSFVTTSGLVGAGIIDNSVFGLLCSTIYAPLYLFDDRGGPDWLFAIAYDAYQMGSAVTH